MRSQSSDKTNDNKAFEKFEDFVRKVVSVPKKEIEKREKDEKQRKEAKRKDLKN